MICFTEPDQSTTRLISLSSGPFNLLLSCSLKKGIQERLQECDAKRNSQVGDMSEVTGKREELQKKISELIAETRHCLKIPLVSFAFCLAIGPANGLSRVVHNTTCTTDCKTK